MHSKQRLFNIARFEHENEMRRKTLKQKKNMESSPFWNPESTELESRIRYSESGIQWVESRIQDCHGFPYMGRNIVGHTSVEYLKNSISCTPELKISFTAFLVSFVTRVMLSRVLFNRERISSIGGIFCNRENTYISNQ